MNKSIKAGIFAVIAIIILLAGWMWLGGIEFKKPGYEITMKFSDITGLRINDPVRVGGVEKGQVRRIRYTQEYIEVKARMDQEVVLYNDANAEILDVAMISGTKYVKLNVGISQVLLLPNAIIEGSSSLGIPLSMIGGIGEKVDNMLGTLNASDVVSLFEETLKNIHFATTGFSDVINKTKDDIENTAINTRKISVRLESTLASLDSILLDMKNGEGTFGQLVTNDTLYHEFQLTLSAIRELAEDIKANPKRYIRLF